VVPLQRTGQAGEHLRVFPLSNWTELDVWQYIAHENIPLPSIYFSHEREVFERDNMLYAANPFVTLLPNEKIKKEIVRFRTDRRHDCTGAVKSIANTSTR
jgi:sulfate adenylyltransferase subunit 2